MFDLDQSEDLDIKPAAGPFKEVPVTPYGFKTQVGKLVV